jgi:glutamate-1-semialdehyde 2,1-aminomutase
MVKVKTYQKSMKAFSQACRYLPGGVDSPVRAFGGVHPVRKEGRSSNGVQPHFSSPLFIAHAKGSKIYDIDGNEYIDYVCSWGAMIVGHSQPAVIKAVREAAKKGTSYGAPTLAESALAKKVTEAFDSIEKVRFVSSGTEAVMTAVRLARGWTKRDLIVKMAGCYHGHSDSLLTSAGSGVAEHAIASSAGVPDSIAKLTVVIPFNDIEAAKAAFRRHKGKIAAVLVEPVAANMGVVPPVEGYLDGLRQLCNQEDSVLIFDEVITGFRVAPGGAQQLYGIRADITTLGKVVGGGLPLAAVGGHADIMDMLAPTGPVYQAGTLSGNPVATAAANATLDLLEARCWILDSRRVSSFEYLESRTALLELGLANAAKEAGAAITINRVGSIMSCFFTNKPVRNFTDVVGTDVRRFKRFFAEMLNRGIYLAPSAYEAMFVSLAHSKKDIEKTIEAAKESFRKACPECNRRVKVVL